MATRPAYNIAVLPGDGIGIDVIEETLRVLRAVEKGLDAFTLRMTKHDCGADCYKRTGNDLPPDTLVACCQADAVLLGAMGDPKIRKPDGTELTPQVTLRVELDLYAGVRPCKLYPGVRTPLANAKPGDIDLLILREQTEGLFASQYGGIVLHDELATDTLIMTRPGVTRIAKFAFQLAKLRPRAKSNVTRKVTCVDKANIFRSYAFFRKIFDEVGNRYSSIAKEHAYIDAMALYLVQKPGNFDVILSDLAAGLVGGMGMAPSADIGDLHAVFQPAHGTAPDIAGKGVANPIAAILSAALMLDWLGRKKEDAMLLRGAMSIEQAVSEVLKSGKAVPVDQGGWATTDEIGHAVVNAVKKLTR